VLSGVELWVYHKEYIANKTLQTLNYSSILVCFRDLQRLFIDLRLMIGTVTHWLGRDVLFLLTSHVNVGVTDWIRST